MGEELTISKSTKISVGVLAGTLVIAIGVISPVVSTALNRMVSATARETRVDMTLNEHARRIEVVEERLEYLTGAMRRVEYVLGTLPADQPTPRNATRGGQ